MGRMDRKAVETALREGIPFEIETAGGSRIKVANAADTLLRSTYMVVVDEEDCPHVIPLLTMAGLRCLPRTG